MTVLTIIFLILYIIGFGEQYQEWKDTPNQEWKGWFCVLFLLLWLISPIRILFIIGRLINVYLSNNQKDL